jgi:hypothetical protein
MFSGEPRKTPDSVRRGSIGTPIRRKSDQYTEIILFKLLCDSWKRSTTSKQGERNNKTYDLQTQIYSLFRDVSERSWKMKLKNWGYEKYSTSADRNISVAKTIKRKRDEGKSTAFFHLGSKIQLSKIECFKRRKTTDGVEEVSPSADRDT